MRLQLAPRSLATALLVLLVAACTHNSLFPAHTVTSVNPQTTDRGVTILTISGKNFFAHGDGSGIRVEACGVSMPASITEPTTRPVLLPPAGLMTMQVGNRITATLPAGGLESGQSSVRVIRPDGSSAVLEDAVTCMAEPQPEPEPEPEPQPEPELVITINEPPAVVIVGATHVFAATINGKPTTAVTWTHKHAGTSEPTVMPHGKFTPTAAGSYTITATSTEHPGSSAATSVEAQVQQLLADPPELSFTALQGTPVTPAQTSHIRLTAASGQPAVEDFTVTAQPEWLDVTPGSPATLVITTNNTPLPVTPTSFTDSIIISTDHATIEIPVHVSLDEATITITTLGDSVINQLGMVSVAATGNCADCAVIWVADTLGIHEAAGQLTIQGSDEEPLSAGQHAVTGHLVYAGQILAEQTAAITVNPLFAQLSAGQQHSLAVDLSGKLWSWGSNGSGKLGHGNSGAETNLSKPTRVHGIEGDPVMVSISAGFSQSAAVDADGTIWTWGDNFYGQLGHGSSETSANKATPTRIEGISGNPAFQIIAPTDSVAMFALDSQGRSWAWGRNDSGQLGLGDQTERHSPVPALPATPEFTSIASGSSHTLAIDKTGSIWSWGRNTSGQLGHADSTNRHTPARISMTGLPAFTIVATGGNHSLALDEQGNLWTWGWGQWGQLGNGSDISDLWEPTAIAVPGNPELTAIAGGSFHSLALDEQGNIWSWGFDNAGQLGHGDSGPDAHRNEPTRINEPDLPRFTAIAAGSYTSFALDEQGNIWSWGANSNGELGQDNLIDSSVPERITTFNHELPEVQ